MSRYWEYECRDQMKNRLSDDLFRACITMHKSKLGITVNNCSLGRKKHNYSISPAFVADGRVAEWSKALDLGSSLSGGVGSNPTSVTFLLLSRGNSGNEFSFKLVHPPLLLGRVNF